MDASATSPTPLADVARKRRRSIRIFSLGVMSSTLYSSSCTLLARNELIQVQNNARDRGPSCQLDRFARRGGMFTRDVCRSVEIAGDVLAHLLVGGEGL